MEGECPARDLEAILPLMHVDTDEKVVRNVQTKNAETERIVHAKVLKYGQNISEVRAYLQDHVPVCDSCLDVYELFLKSQTKNEYEVLECDRDHLGLLEY